METHGARFRHSEPPLAGVVLAAGFGTRLRPLTNEMPKALCRVGGTPLVDLALQRLQPVTSSVAVNAHHFAEQMVEHLSRSAPDVHVSVEQPAPFGTAGAIGALRDWIGGRPAVVTNADAWLLPNDLAPMLDGWDGHTVRLLVVEDPARPDFGGRWRFAGASTLPATVAAALEPVPSSLYDVVWAPRLQSGELELVVHDGEFIDCGTLEDYRAADEAASA